MLSKSILSLESQRLTSFDLLSRVCPKSREFPASGPGLLRGTLFLSSLVGGSRATEHWLPPKRDRVSQGKGGLALGWEPSSEAAFLQMPTARSAPVASACQQPPLPRIWEEGKVRLGGGFCR